MFSEIFIVERSHDLDGRGLLDCHLVSGGLGVVNLRDELDNVGDSAGGVDSVAGDVASLIPVPVLASDLDPHLVAAVPPSEEAAGDHVVLAGRGHPHGEVALDVGGGGGGVDPEREDVSDPLASVTAVMVPPELDPCSSRGKVVVESIGRLEAVLVL